MRPAASRKAHEAARAGADCKTVFLTSIQLSWNWRHSSQRGVPLQRFQGIASSCRPSYQMLQQVLTTWQSPALACCDQALQPPHRSVSVCRPCTPCRPRRCSSRLQPGRYLSQPPALERTQPQATSNKHTPGETSSAPAWIQKIIGESEYSSKFRFRRWLLFSGLVLGYSFYYLCRNSLNYVLPVMVNDKSLGLSITQLAATTSIFPIAYGALGLLLASQQAFSQRARQLGTRVSSNSFIASALTVKPQAFGLCHDRSPPGKLTTLCSHVRPYSVLLVTGHLQEKHSQTRAGASKFLSGVLGAKLSPRLMLSVGLMATATVNIMFGFSSSLVLFCVIWAINGTLQVRLPAPCVCQCGSAVHLHGAIAIYLCECFAAHESRRGHTA
jgi:hypothetical protein